ADRSEPAMITGVSKAVVLVDDQDEVRAAWSGHVGVDATLQGAGGEERWIEVAPPAQSLSLVASVPAMGPSSAWTRSPAGPGPLRPGTGVTARSGQRAAGGRWSGWYGPGLVAGVFADSRAGPGGRGSGRGSARLPVAGCAGWRTPIGWRHVPTAGAAPARRAASRHGRRRWGAGPRWRWAAGRPRGAAPGRRPGARPACGGP